jgi:hypothetical protein
MDDRCIPYYDALADKHNRYMRTQSFRKHYQGYLEMRSDARISRSHSLATKLHRASVGELHSSSAPHLPVAGMGGLPSLEVATVSTNHLSLEVQVDPHPHTHTPTPSWPLTSSAAPPTREQLKAIDERELYLNRLHVLLTRMPLEPEPQQLDQIRADLADTLAGLRLASVNVVEAIGRWRRRRPQHEAFVWRSHNYMLKMLVDLFFLGLAPTVADAVADPFLLRCFAMSPPGRSRPLPPPLTEGSAKRLLRLWFAPSRRHTQHHLLRMWAAEKTVAQERHALGFEPAPPVLEQQDILRRAKAAYFFYGAQPADDAMMLQGRLGTRDGEPTDTAAMHIQANIRRAAAVRQADELREARGAAVEADATVEADAAGGAKAAGGVEAAGGAEAAGEPPAAAPEPAISEEGPAIEDEQVAAHPAAPGGHAVEEPPPDQPGLGEPTLDEAGVDELGVDGLAIEEGDINDGGDADSPIES